MLNGTTLSQTSRPAQPPIDLESGRPEPHAVALLGGAVVVALFVAMVGGIVVVLSYDKYEMTGVRWVLALFGGGLALAGGAIGWTLARVLVGGWRAHQCRVDEWHNAALDAYDAAQGQVVEQSLTEWSLSCEQPRDVLLAALAIQAAAARGMDRPWSVRKLAGSLYLGDNSSRSILLGELAPSEAERMAAMLERIGLIRGRAERSAGQWSARTADEVVDKVVRGMRSTTHG
jgi:hypothetical protein